MRRTARAVEARALVAVAKGSVAVERASSAALTALAPVETASVVEVMEIVGVARGVVAKDLVVSGAGIVTKVGRAVAPAGVSQTSRRERQVEQPEE